MRIWFPWVFSAGYFVLSSFALPNMGMAIGLTMPFLYWSFRYTLKVWVHTSEEARQHQPEGPANQPKKPQRKVVRLSMK